MAANLRRKMGTYFNKFLVLLCYKLDTSGLIGMAEDIVGVVR